MKISVILTSYNHEKYLAESIDSIIKQTYKDFEFIIVDDCSTDSSWQIIEEYKNAYPEIIILRHEHNWNGGTVADTVKNYATGEYIAIHHSDDVWEADKLEKQAAVFKEHPDYAAVFTNACAIDEEGNIYEDESGFYYNLFQVENRSRHEWLNHFFYHGNCLCHPSILIKKSVYEEEDFFRKGLKQIPDFVKWIQMCKKYEIYVIPEVLVKFRVRSAGQNTSGMRSDTQIRSTVELFLMLQEYVDIHDQEEFFAIFPSARKYCSGSNISTAYILGRICTEEGMPPYTRLFGIQQLYKALNSQNKEEQKQICRSFSANEFAKANGQYDLFGILPRGFEQDRTIYYDCGNGYNSENTVKQRYTLDQEITFRMCALIQTSDKGIRRLRFDPAEGIPIRAKIEKISINGEQVGAAAENALLEKAGEDIFVNLDPIYELEIPESIVNLSRMEVEIQGRISRLTEAEIGDVVSDFMYCSRDEKNELVGRLTEEEELYRVSILQKEELLENEKRLNQNYEIIVEELNRTLKEKNSLENEFQMLSVELNKELMEKANLEKKVGTVSDELAKAEEYRISLGKEYETALVELSNMSAAMKELEQNRDMVSNELQNIKNSRWYKLWRKYVRMREGHRRSE